MVLVDLLECVCCFGLGLNFMTSVRVKARSIHVKVNVKVARRRATDFTLFSVGLRDQSRCKCNRKNSV